MLYVNLFDLCACIHGIWTFAGIFLGGFILPQSKVSPSQEVTVTVTLHCTRKVLEGISPQYFFKDVGKTPSQVSLKLFPHSISPGITSQYLCRSLSSQYLSKYFTSHSISLEVFPHSISQSILFGSIPLESIFYLAVSLWKYSLTVSLWKYSLTVSLKVFYFEVSLWKYSLTVSLWKYNLTVSLWKYNLTVSLKLFYLAVSLWKYSLTVYLCNSANIPSLCKLPFHSIVWKGLPRICYFSQYSLTISRSISSQSLSPVKFSGISLKTWNYTQVIYFIFPLKRKPL